MARKTTAGQQGAASSRVELSDLDKAILAELTVDPFASNAMVAKALDVATSLVSSRLRILERDKVSQVLAVLDLDRMKQSFCFIQVDVRGRAIAEVAEDIAVRRLVLMVSELGSGSADLLVLVRYADIHELDAILFDDIARIKGISSWQVNMITDFPVFRSEYVSYSSHYLPMSVEQNIEYLRQDIPEGLCDESDLQILAHLQQNAHQSINDISRKLGMKSSTARYRINNLKSAEILRFIRVVDQTSVGINTFTLAEISVELGRIDAIVEELRGKDWLPQLFRCVGNCDLMGILLTGGSAEMLRVKREELLAIDGIKAVKLTNLYRTHKNDLRWAQTTR